jgi:antagonist of KipI
MTKLRFIKTGLQTTIQDLGRTGHQHLGIPVGGVMDKRSARLANDLVGNPTEYPLFEITLLGPTIRFEGACQIAITGAMLSPEINGQAIAQNQTIHVNDGDLLNFGKPIAGCRAYFAVRGQWKVPQWLGSCSASTSKGEIATPDSWIKKDAFIEVESDSSILPKTSSETLQLDALQIPIKVIPGPEFHLFSNFFVGLFFSKTFTITPDSNRMGYRLTEPIEGYESLGEIISSGVIPGTIQITNAGQAIVLMADAQTTGGYPRLLNLLTPEIDRMAQLKPGDSVRFELIKH